MYSILPFLPLLDRAKRQNDIARPKGQPRDETGEIPPAVHPGNGQVSQLGVGLGILTKFPLLPWPFLPGFQAEWMDPKGADESYKKIKEILIMKLEGQRKGPI
jgi:hypothetical protein